MKGMRPLREEEVAVILNSLAARERALFLLGTKSGFRISEMLSLRVRDVYQDGLFLDYVSVERKHMKKKVEGRTIVLHPGAKAALEAWFQELLRQGNLKEDSFIFLSRAGLNKAISRIQAWRLLKKAYRRNSLTGRLGTHSMRKTFADRVHEKLGHDLAKTQKALGHRNINSTVSYLSFKEEEIEKAILSL